MLKPSMNLVIAINQKYVPYAYVMLTSLLLHTPYPVCVYVFHHALTSADEKSLCQLSDSYAVNFHFVFVPDTLLPPPEVLATSNWGIEAYFRLAITDLLPASVNRALYLDTDMIINQPIAELYFCNLNGNKIAACKEFVCTPPFDNYRDDLFQPLFADSFCYFNSGMILYDLDALRPSYSFQTYMETAKFLDYKMQFPDQDLLNYCHHKETLFVDPFCYNLNARYAYDLYGMRYEDMKQTATIIHYASSKPWRGNFIHYNVEQIWWDYASKTPFYIYLLQHAIDETLTNTAVNSYVENLIQKNNELYARIAHYENLLIQADIQI